MDPETMSKEEAAQQAQHLQQAVAALAAPEGRERLLAAMGAACRGIVQSIRSASEAIGRMPGLIAAAMRK